MQKHNSRFLLISFRHQVFFTMNIKLIDNHYLILAAYLYLNEILPFDKSYGDISTFTLSPGRMRM